MGLLGWPVARLPRCSALESRLRVGFAKRADFLAGIVGGTFKQLLSLRLAAFLRAVVMIRGPESRSAALRLAGGWSRSCCQATGCRFAWPRRQARRVMIRRLVADCAALGLRAVGGSAHCCGLLRQVGM